MRADPDIDPVVIGPYEVFGRLARGRESTILAANLRGVANFSRSVAIKCLDSTVPTAAAAFYREANYGAAMEHANLATTIDVGVWQQRPYFVTAIICGWTVRSIAATAALTQSAIPIDVALAIIHGAADGLHFLHEIRGRDGKEAGLVHCAIDDTNVMVARAGGVKVLDFGALAAAAAQHSVLQSNGSSDPFCAREIGERRAIDRRADIYSLGILLKRLLSHDRRQPHDDISALVRRASADRPRDRFATAADLQRAIERLASRRDLVISARRVRRYLQYLFQPAQQRDAEALTGVALGRRKRARRQPTNGGRTRVRITRHGNAVTAAHQTPRRPVSIRTSRRKRLSSNS